jgi:hypothetical protein
MVTSFIQTAKESSESRGQKTSSSSQHATADQRIKDLSVHSSPQACQTSSAGHLDINGSELNYFGATHWVTILENVCILYGRRS